MLLLAELRNDHKGVSREIEEALHSLHSASRPPAGPTFASGGGSAASLGGRGSASAPAAGVVANDGPPLPPPSVLTTASWSVPLEAVPFAVAERVADGSPAMWGGLLCGDELLSFDRITSVSHEGWPDPLAAVAARLPGRENLDTAVVVLREGTPVNLTLVPQKWPGRGLLGVFWKIIKTVR